MKKLVNTCNSHNHAVLLEACQAAYRAIVLGNGQEIDWDAVADQLRAAITVEEGEEGKMKYYNGVPTLNYTEAQFLRLPRMGKKSLLLAKAAGCEFAPPPPDNGFDPVGRVSNFDPSSRTVAHRDRDEEGMFAPLGTGNRPSEAERLAKLRQELPTDGYGNTLDGGEMD